MSRRWSLKKKNNKIVYNILNINENTKDKDCINADNQNEKKYQAVMKKAGETNKLWNNTGVTMNIDVPAPLKPNNYDRLLDFRRKNVLRPSIQQSKATIYLYKNGYKLGKDYEAFQAIEIYNKLKKMEKEEDVINEILEDKELDKSNKIKNLSLLEKVTKSKNIYPNLEISNENNNVKKKKIYNGWEKKGFSFPKIETPLPSAPPPPELFEKGINIFSGLEKKYYSTSSDDSNYEC